MFETLTEKLNQTFKKLTNKSKMMENNQLHPADYYIDEMTGFSVFTALYLRNRGYCCGSGCRHCPFIPKHKKNSTIVRTDENEG